MKICPVGAELFHVDGMLDGLDGANSQFLQFRERALKKVKLTLEQAVEGVGDEGHALSALPLGKRPDTNFTGGWAASPDRCRKSLFPPLGFSPKTSKPVASCYTNYTERCVRDMDAKNTWSLVPCCFWGKLLMMWGFWSRILYFTDTGIAVFSGFEICDSDFNAYANLSFCPYLLDLYNKFKKPPQLWEFVLLDSFFMPNTCLFLHCDGRCHWTHTQQASFIWDHICVFHSSG